MTVFAVLAHFKAAGISATMIAGGTFAETWEAYHKYNRLQVFAAWLSLALVVIGTLIWGYGIWSSPSPPEEEQNAIAFGITQRVGSHRSQRGDRLTAEKPHIYLVFAALTQIHQL
jgi:hypothetical protein